MISQLINMGFDKALAEHALVQVNFTSIEAAIEIITNNEASTPPSYGRAVNLISNESCHQPSTSAASSVLEEARHIPDNVCDPVFCRDGVSATLEKLYSTANVKTHHHAVFVLIHALMLESGFCLKHNIEKLQTTEMLPVGWNSNNIVRLSYVNKLSSSISCQLVITSLGPFIYAHVWSAEIQSNAYKVKLIVSQYIRGDIQLTQGAKYIYKNLHKVSRLVKNKMVHPILANIHSYLGLTSPLSLTGLPPEIQLMILSQLTAADLLTLSVSCKTLKIVCNDEKLWQFFCQRDFGVEKNTVESWKKQYKMLYQRRKQQLKRNQMGASSSSFPEISPVVPGFNPFLPRIPHILGGPHDLYPHFLTGQPRDESSLRIIHPDDRSRSDLRLRTDTRATRGTFFA
ncbi:F-box only protein 7-like isoform X2 [Dendronephthya gigantea]|nr:F-box only protein 7-like isoform X2 [Dendronephthya gigantea]